MKNHLYTFYSPKNYPHPYQINTKNVQEILPDLDPNVLRPIVVEVVVHLVLRVELAVPRLHSIQIVVIPIDREFPVNENVHLLIHKTYLC